jgi:hypothetical protein
MHASPASNPLLLLVLAPKNVGIPQTGALGCSRPTWLSQILLMDWLTFIAEMTKALAWPVAAVVAFLALRNQLTQRFSALESLKWKDFEFRFASEVHRIAAEAQMAVPEPEVRSLPATTEEERRAHLADLSPRAAIIEAWIGLESAAAVGLRSRGVAITDREIYQPARLAEALISSRLLNASQADVLKELRRLRNAAAHAEDPKITPETAREFVDVAGALERLIRKRTAA